MLQTLCLTSGFLRFLSGVETPDAGISAVSFLAIGAVGGETEADVRDGEGAGFGGCANATIEAATTANMTIVLFIGKPRPVKRFCQAGPGPRR
jgi:hypothetical protein